MIMFFLTKKLDKLFMLGGDKLEYQQLLKEYQQAMNNFNNADADYVEAAIFELRAAELKLEAYLKKEKRKEVMQ